MSFKANNDIVMDSFLLAWFSSQLFLEQMNSSFEGSVRNTLSYENLVKMKIIIPSIGEQKKIADFHSKLEQKINKIENNIIKIENWKKGLLQKMFC